MGYKDWDKNIQKEFWAKAKNDIGLTEDEIHEGLAVESLNDWTGAFQEAIEQLRQFKKRLDLDRWLHETLKGLGSGPEGLAEAPASLNLFGRTSKGWNVQITLRDVSEFTLMKRFVALTAALEKLHIKPVDRNGNYIITEEIVKQAAAAIPTAPPPPPGQAAPQTESATHPLDILATPHGTDPLNKITVDADGKVEFHVGKFRYPFKDSRGAEKAIGYFDPALGWKAEHLHPGAKYEGETVAGIKVDWEKPDKYYNVTRVYR